MLALRAYVHGSAGGAAAGDEAAPPLVAGLEGLAGAGQRVRAPLLHTNTDTGGPAGGTLRYAGRTLQRGMRCLRCHFAVWQFTQLCAKPSLGFYPTSGRLTMEAPTLQGAPKTHALRPLRPSGGAFREGSGTGTE